MPTPEEMIDNIRDFLSTPGTLISPMKTTEIGVQIDELNKLIDEQHRINNAIIYYALLSTDESIKTIRDDLLQVTYLCHAEDIIKLTEAQKTIVFSNNYNNSIYDNKTEYKAYNNVSITKLKDYLRNLYEKISMKVKL